MKTENTYCDKMKSLILLEESGELTTEQAAELQQHLDQCPACVDYRSDVALILEQGRKSLIDASPSDQTVARIMSEAEGRGKVIRFVNPLRYVAAAAAVLALMLGTYIAVYSPNGGSGGSDSYGVDDVQIMVAMVSDGEVGGAETEAGTASEDQLQELADTLLKLQGFKVEEESEEEEDITDLFLPKALQSHSTHVSASGTSV